MLKFALGWTYSLGISNFSPYDIIIIKEGNIGVMLILIFSAGG